MFLTRQHDNNGIHEVNMTPLIDVSLVLVIMLLLATPLAFESSIAVRKSAASAKAAAQKSDELRIELRIISEEEVRVNKTVVPRADLVEALEPLIRESSQGIVVIRCNDDVSHGTFVDVLDKAKRSGAAEIAVTGKK